MNERAITGVVVDAGHGGSDPGAVSNGLQEKDFTLQAAEYMYQRLQELGIPAVIIRDSDESLSREERLRRANEAFGGSSNAILISNHINAGGGEGAEVIYALRNSSTLARNILESIGQEGQIMRKYYQRRLPEDPSKDYYYIIRETNPMQSLLVEYGFIDNANDRVKLQNDLLNYVEAVVRAIANYAGVTYVPPEGSNYHVVQKGDSLWSIANRYGVSVAALKAANNLTSDVLQIGQTLIIPSTSNDNTTTTTYTVQSGDTLWSIASRFNISVNQLKNANNLTSDTLSVGQRLIIPGNASSDNNDNNNNPVTPVIYTVQSGDSLWSIANRYNTTVDAIKQANNLTSNLLSVGQQLTIPTSGSSDNNESQTTYTVKSGDSLWSIARNFNITVDQLKAANNLSSNLLQVGQVLIIPTGGSGDFNTTTMYTVQSGDSLWQIANRYNTTVDAIKRLNGLTTNLLQIGQQLIIPTT